MINFGKLIGKVSGLKGMMTPAAATVGALKRIVSKQSRPFRVRIEKGLPNSKKMKEGQLKLCIIKDTLYLVVKHKNKLFNTALKDEKL